MTSRTRSGVILVSEKSFSATVVLSLVSAPGSPVRRQQVEVEFHGEAPNENMLALSPEFTFSGDDGSQHALQYTRGTWLLRNAQDFLG